MDNINPIIKKLKSRKKLVTFLNFILFYFILARPTPNNKNIHMCTCLAKKKYKKNIYKKILILKEKIKLSRRKENIPIIFNPSLQNGPYRKDYLIQHVFPFVLKNINNNK